MLNTYSKNNAGFEEGWKHTDEQMEKPRIRMNVVRVVFVKIVVFVRHLDQHLEVCAP